MDYIETLGAAAKQAALLSASLKSAEKNAVLSEIAERLRGNTKQILAANAVDIENAKRNGMTASLIDRLTLTEERIYGIAEGVEKVISLPDPIGGVIGGGEFPNGLRIVKRRVPIGVIGMIFESRPNVTVDAAILCFKAGNAVILRGGSDAINSNKALAELMRSALETKGIDKNCIQLVEDTSRETANAMMRMNDYIDLLIPRGGGGLIRAVVNNASIPVVQTGEGNCHVYVDESADIDMAVNIINNAKTQRPSVCNAIESILVHKNAAPRFFEKLADVWNGRVAVIGDEETAKYISVERIADENDYAAEFLDYKLSSRVVDNIDEAISHINRFGTRHSECIVTSSLKAAEHFQQMVDAAAVYVNASTRFTDGFEFGLGAEIGISTQKLHVRGPMGLEALTTYKYLVNGDGQIRG